MRGFTLIELMAVVTIICILALINAQSFLAGVGRDRGLEQRVAKLEARVANLEPKRPRPRAPGALPSPAPAGDESWRNPQP